MAGHANLLQTGSPTKPSLRTYSSARVAIYNGIGIDSTVRGALWQGTFMEGAGYDKTIKTR